MSDIIVPDYEPQNSDAPSEFDGPAPTQNKQRSGPPKCWQRGSMWRTPRGMCLLGTLFAIFLAICLSIYSAIPDAPVPPPPPAPDYCQDKSTDGKWDYSQNFIGQPLGISKALYFTVQADSDARVAFFDSATDKEAMPRAEIIISGWDNTQSVITYGLGNEKDSRDTTGFLSADETREFWASAWTGEIKLGQGAVVGENVLLSWIDPAYLSDTNADPYSRYVSVTTVGGSGTWHICLTQGLPAALTAISSEEIWTTPTLVNAGFEEDPTATQLSKVPSGWTGSASGLTIVAAASPQWQNLSAADGVNFLAILGNGYAETTVTDLAPGDEYEVRFQVADAATSTACKSSGSPPELHTLINGNSEWETTHPADVFVAEAFMFTSQGRSATLRLQNDSPTAACTVFIDGISVNQVEKDKATNIRNPGFEIAWDRDSHCDYPDVDDSTSDCGYRYGLPKDWSGDMTGMHINKFNNSLYGDGTGVVLVKNCNAQGGVPENKWTMGCLSSFEKSFFVALQGGGTLIEQRVHRLQKSKTYQVEFLAARTPGGPADETLNVQVWTVEKDLQDFALPGGDANCDEDPMCTNIWENTNLAQAFHRYTAAFETSATTSAAVLRFRNSSPAGDKTIYIDQIVIYKEKTQNG